MNRQQRKQNLLYAIQQLKNSQHKVVTKNINGIINDELCKETLAQIDSEIIKKQTEIFRLDETLYSY